jgi:hypothetical protein
VFRRGRFLSGIRHDVRGVSFWRTKSWQIIGRGLIG